MKDPTRKSTTETTPETDQERRVRLGLAPAPSPFGLAHGGGLYLPRLPMWFGGQSQDDETDSDKETDEHAD